MSTKPTWFKALLFIFVVAAIAMLYWLTLEQDSDPCAQAQQDISAAVLADEPDSQDALANRAIIMRGACEEVGDASGDE